MRPGWTDFIAKQKTEIRFAEGLCHAIATDKALIIAYIKLVPPVYYCQVPLMKRTLLEQLHTDPKKELQSA